MDEWLKVKVAITQFSQGKRDYGERKRTGEGEGDGECHDDGFYLSMSTKLLQTHLKRMNNFYLIAPFWLVFTFSHSLIHTRHAFR